MRTNVKGYPAPSAHPFPSKLNYRIPRLSRRGALARSGSLTLAKKTALGGFFIKRL